MKRDKIVNIVMAIAGSGILIFGIITKFINPDPNPNHMFDMNAFPFIVAGLGILFVAWFSHFLNDMGY